MSERTRFKSLLQLFTASWVSRVPFGDSVFLVCKMHITALPPPPGLVVEPGPWHVLSTQ